MGEKKKNLWNKEALLEYELSENWLIVLLALCRLSTNVMNKRRAEGP